MSLFRGAGVFGEAKKNQSPANRSTCETLEPTKTRILDVKCAVVESVSERQKSIKGLIRCETKGQILCKKDFSISWKDARLCTSNNRRHKPPAFLNWRRVFEVIESYLRWKWTSLFDFNDDDDGDDVDVDLSEVSSEQDQFSSSTTAFITQPENCELSKLSSFCEKTVFQEFSSTIFSLFCFVSRILTLCSSCSRSCLILC